MKVSDLIKQMLDICDERNPEEVDVILLQFNHGSDWPEVSTPLVSFQGGNDHPFVVTIK